MTLLKGLFVLFTVILAVAAAAYQPEPEKKTVDPAAKLANPASAYCPEQGGVLQMGEGEAGTYGVCVFPDGSKCEEWAFFHGTCQPGMYEEAEDDLRK